jgi:ammonia channel protein AmtB
MACIILPGESWSWAGTGTTIYGTRMTLSALAFGIVLAVSGGIIGAWVFTRDPFWMMSGALAGIISVASGLDIYFPSQIIIIAILAGIILKPCADFLESFGIDDAVGAVTVHGTIGIFGVLMLGVMASGYPALDAYAPEGVATITLWGQFVGSIVFILLGIVPGYIVSAILKSLGMLRVPDAVQEKGLDVVKVPAQAYPEGMNSPASEDV